MNSAKLAELVKGPQADRDSAINDAAVNIGYVAATLRLVDTALPTGYKDGLYRELDLSEDASSAVRLLASVLDENVGVIYELT